MKIDKKIKREEVHVDNSSSAVRRASASKSVSNKVCPRDRYELCTPLTSPPHYDLEISYTWCDFLDTVGMETPAVYNFSSAPLNDIWQNIAPGMKLEVPNPEYSESSALGAVFWIAQANKICGYKALMRFEGANSETNDFWVNLCCDEVHPVGWCAQKSRPLVPPKSIQDQHPDKKSAQDWKSFLAKRLTGARTLPMEFHDRVKKALTSRFRPGVRVEVVDRKRIQQLKPAIVKEVIGHRLRVKYVEVVSGATPTDLIEEDSDSDDDEEPPDDEFWTHERSPLLHPVGWAATTGHEIACSREYRRKSSEKADSGKYDPDDATPDMFEKHATSHAEATVGRGLQEFQPGMKLEAIDPLDLSSIVCATVDRVLKGGYLMIRFDGAGDSFCYHQSSPCIFPVGFCNTHAIKLTPPKGASSKFDWPDYLKQTKSVAAPVALFNTELVNHKFRVGMKLEATDLMDPRLVCVATIADVKGRLLRVHYDGWEENFDQWCDCYAPETYPVGWCEMVGYKLEAPRDENRTPLKKRPKSAQQQQAKLRKKRKLKMSPSAVCRLPSPDRDASNASQSLDGRSSELPNLSCASAGFAGDILPEVLTPQSDEGNDQLFVPDACRTMPVASWTPANVRQFVEANGVLLPAQFSNLNGEGLSYLRAIELIGGGMNAADANRLVDFLKSLPVRPQSSTTKSIH